MRGNAPRADAADVIARIVTVLAAGLLLAGCTAEEGRQAQALLRQAETAQAQLRSSTFEGRIAMSMDGQAFDVLFNGVTSDSGEWISMRTRGAPNGADMKMQLLVRDGRAWTNLDGRWQSTPLPKSSSTGSAGTLNAAAFQQLAQHVKDVRVTEHQLIGGKPVTTIAGEIDTQGMLETLLDAGSFAEGLELDVSKLGLEIGDIGAVLSIDERTHLLDTATVSFSMSAEGKRATIELRYRLTGANRPVRLPSPPS